MDVDTLDLSNVAELQNILLPNGGIFAEGMHRVRVWVATEDMTNGVLAGSQDINVTNGNVGSNAWNVGLISGDGANIKIVSMSMSSWWENLLNVIKTFFNVVLKQGDTTTLRAEVGDGVP